MSTSPDLTLLNVILESWDLNNLIMLNLLGVVPVESLAAKTTESSHSVSEMFTHMHHERMISVSEEAPEFRPKVPEKEWVFESNPEAIARMLTESARLVRDAVKARVEAGRGLELNFSHPIHLILFLIFHEGYHHGQIKTALKVAGCPIPDDIAGPLTWDVWRGREGFERVCNENSV